MKSLAAKFLPLLAANVDPEQISVCNNAIWALGEIAVKIGDDMKPYVPLFIKQLVLTINRERTPRTLLENTGLFHNLLPLVVLVG